MSITREEAEELVTQIIGHFDCDIEKDPMFTNLLESELVNIVLTFLGDEDED